MNIAHIKILFVSKSARFTASLANSIYVCLFDLNHE